jgi:hypothetical protein
LNDILIQIVHDDFNRCVVRLTRADLLVSKKHVKGEPIPDSVKRNDPVVAQFFDSEEKALTISRNRPALLNATFQFRNQIAPPH